MASSSKPKRVSPYFAFCKKHREDVKHRLSQEAPGKPISAPVLTKALSELWRSLSDAEKKSYKASPADEEPPVDPTENDQRTVGNTGEDAEEEVIDKDSVEEPDVDKEDIEEEGEDEDEGEGEEEEEEEVSNAGGPGSELELGFTFPLARVKRIIKLDKEIRVVASDASILISHATHLFLEHLVELSYKASSQKRHKTVRYDDVMAGIALEPRVHDFLSHALGDESFHSRQAKAECERSVVNDNNDDGDNEDDDDDRAVNTAVVVDHSKKPKVVKKVPPPELSAGTRRIADFFAAKPSKTDAVLS